MTYRDNVGVHVLHQDLEDIRLNFNDAMIGHTFLVVPVRGAEAPLDRQALFGTIATAGALTAGKLDTRKSVAVLCSGRPEVAQTISEAVKGKGWAVVPAR